MRRHSFLLLLVAVLGLLTLGVPIVRGASPGFHPEQVNVWRGRTQVIAFQLSDAADKDTQYATQSADAKSLQIVEPAAVLAGQKVGFVRVRGLTAGSTSIKVGDATLKVAVTEPAARAVEGSLSPAMLGPASGTFLWGVMDLAASTPADFAAVAPGVASVRLRLADGAMLDAVAKPHAVGSRMVWRFTLDADALKPGPLTVTAVATDKDGVEHIGESRRFVIVRPSESSLIAGECEAVITDDWKERYEQDPPPIGSHPDASDGVYIANYSADPMWRLPVNVKETGVYQMVVRARGSRAAGALPAVGVIVDRAQQPTVAANLVDEGWHRVAVGPTFTLQPGEHVLGVRFLNDFYAPNRADRNLLLDRYELLRVGTPAEAAKLAGSAPLPTVEPAFNDALRIAFMQVFDGKPVTGQLIIKGFCWQPDSKAPAPRVSLLVNGETVSTQQANEPVFWLDAAALKTGSNTVQLIAAQPDGAAAMTPVQTVRVIDELAPRQPRAARRFYRFDAEDRAWSAAIESRRSDRDRTAGHAVAAFESDGSVTLKLPADLTGEFDVFIDARGEDGGTPPKIKLSHLQGGASQMSRDMDVAGWWRPREAGSVKLQAGANEIELAVSGVEAGRRVWLGSVMLYERRAGADRSPPRVQLRYPLPDQVVSGADVIIAEAMDDDRLTEVDLLIDGVPQALNPLLEGQAGRFVLPLVVGDLSPGTHRLSVRVRDVAGNVGDSREVTVNVAAKSATHSPYVRAVHLLNRLGYGPEPDELADVLLMGEKQYVTDRLSRGSEAPASAGDMSALGLAATRYPQVTDDYHVQHRAIQQGISTNNPLRYRFVLFAQNHFSTWIRKTEGAAKWQEHLRFNELGAAPFGELLLASATSPAMLWYLDQQRSYAGAINENYAREIMELHTLGVRGGYTQADVTSLAHLLSGWGAAEEAPASGRGFPYGRTFYFDSALNDTAGQRIIGIAFEGTSSDSPPAVSYDRARRMLEVLASHPSTARHIATKMAEHYVAAPAPSDLVDHLAATFTASGGDTRAMLVAMIEHPAFWLQIDQPRLAKPMTYALRIARVAGGDSPWQVGQCLSNSGVMIFDRATPDGYPQEDSPYADSNAMLQRWQFARGMEWTLWRLLPPPWVGNERESRAAWARRLGDVAAIRLTGQPLSEQSRQACVQFAESAEGATWERALQLVTFVGQLPEANRY
jgi:hypothetical protein